MRSIKAVSFEVFFISTSRFTVISLIHLTPERISSCWRELRTRLRSYQPVVAANSESLENLFLA